MKQNFLWLSLTFFTSLVFAGGASGESTGDSRPSVRVNSFAIVKGSSVLLGDIAKVSAREAAFERIVNELKTVKLADSPPPKTRLGIPGAKILEAIQEKGIALDSIGYSVPQIVQVERAGRTLTQDEVLSEVRALLGRDSMLDVQAREVAWDAAQIIPEGFTKINVEKMGEPAGGKLPIRVVVSVDELPAARFMGTVLVDDWREVPVLNKTLERGMLISPNDVELVRLNLNQQPPDVADSLNDVLGHAVKTRMAAGGTLRRSLIDIPPLVTQGKKVSILYSAGGLTATAQGVSLDDGLKGEEIRVKNDSSKKIVRARILSADDVEVK